MLGNFKSVFRMWSPSSLLTPLDLESPIILRNTCSVPVGFPRNDQLKRKKGCIIFHILRKWESKEVKWIKQWYLALSSFQLCSSTTSNHSLILMAPTILAFLWYPAIQSCPWDLRQHLLYNKAEEWAMFQNLIKYFEKLYLEYSVSFLSVSWMGCWVPWTLDCWVLLTCMDNWVSCFRGYALTYQANVIKHPKEIREEGFVWLVVSEESVSYGMEVGSRSLMSKMEARER